MLDSVPNAEDIEAELRAYHALMPFVQAEAKADACNPFRDPWTRTPAMQAEALLMCRYGTGLVQYEEILEAPTVSTAIN